MRLSTVQIFQQGVNAILDRQFELNQTQQQIASGKRVSSPADDPIAAHALERLARYLFVEGDERCEVP